MSRQELEEEQTLPALLKWQWGHPWDGQGVRDLQLGYLGFSGTASHVHEAILTGSCPGTGAGLESRPDSSSTFSLCRC